MHMKLMKIISTNILIRMKLYLPKKTLIWHDIPHKIWYAIKRNNPSTNQPTNQNGLLNCLLIVSYNNSYNEKKYLSTNYSLTNHIYKKKLDLALNNQQGLICH